MDHVALSGSLPPSQIPPVSAPTAASVPARTITVARVFLEGEYRPAVTAAAAPACVIELNVPERPRYFLTSRGIGSVELAAVDYPICIGSCPEANDILKSLFKRSDHEAPGFVDLFKRMLDKEKVVFRILDRAVYSLSVRHPEYVEKFLASGMTIPSGVELIPEDRGITIQWAVPCPHCTLDVSKRI